MKILQEMDEKVEKLLLRKGSLHTTVVEVLQSVYSQHKATALWPWLLYSVCWKLKFSKVPSLCKTVFYLPQNFLCPFFQWALKHCFEQYLVFLHAEHIWNSLGCVSTLSQYWFEHFASVVALLPRTRSSILSTASFNQSYPFVSWRMYSRNARFACFLSPNLT